MVSYQIRTLFRGCYRNVKLPASASLVDVRAAIASTFDIGEGTNLSLAYRNADGHEIIFDGDSEVVIFLRLCGDRLEVVVDVDGAARNDTCVRLEDHSLHPQRLEAAYSLAVPGPRTSPCVAHVAPQDLQKSLKLLQLRPRRVIATRAAPGKLLVDEEVSASLCHSRDGKCWHDPNKNLGEAEDLQDVNDASVLDKSSRGAESKDSNADGRQKDNKGIGDEGTVTQSADAAALAACGVMKRPSDVGVAHQRGEVLQE